MMPVPQKSTPFAVDANGVPSDSDCNSIDWSTSYLDYAVGNAFGRLYDNYDSLGDAWAMYWLTVSTNYHMLPGVLGYDLMNGNCATRFFFCFLAFVLAFILVLLVKTHFPLMWSFFYNFFFFF